MPLNYLNFSNPEGTDAVLGRRMTRGASLGSGLLLLGHQGRRGDSQPPASTFLNTQIRNRLVCGPQRMTRRAAATLPSKPGTPRQVGTSPSVQAGPGPGFWVLLARETSPWGYGGREPPGSAAVSGVTFLSGPSRRTLAPHTHSTDEAPRWGHASSHKAMVNQGWVRIK